MFELSKGLDSISQRASRHGSRFPYLGVGNTLAAPSRSAPPRHPDLVDSTFRQVGLPAWEAGHIQTACRGSQIRFG